jgi:uncharacterized protein (DUF1330 family)
MKVVAPVAEKTTAGAGGHFLARGKLVSLSGEPPRGRLVIVQFENMDQLQKWWNNPEWQAAHNKGEQYAKFRDMAIEGVSPKVAECRRLQRRQGTATMAAMHLFITAGTPQRIPTATLPHTTADIPAIMAPGTGALFVPHKDMVIAGDRHVRR